MTGLPRCRSGSRALRRWWPGRWWPGRWWPGRLVVIALGLLFAGQSTLAQEVAPGWQLRRWGPEHGLPVVGVNAIERDARGYLWLATFDGLFRFDGVRFVDATPGPTLPSRRLTTLWRGRNEALWLSTEAFHLVRYAAGRAEHVVPPEPDAGQVEVIGRDPDGRLVFGLGRCLYPEGETGLAEPSICLPAGRVRSFMVRADGTTWVGSNDGRLYRGEPGGTLEQVTSLPPRPIDALAVDREGVAWIGTSAGLFRTADSTTERVPLGEADSVLRLELQPDGALWVVTTAGLHRIAPHGAVDFTPTDTFTGRETINQAAGPAAWRNTGRELVQDGRTVLRVSGTIKDLLADPEGNLWVATDRLGLLRLRQRSVVAADTALGLPTSSVYPVVEGPDGAVWIGTNGTGLIRARHGRAEELRSDHPELSHVWSVLPEGPETALVGGRGLWRFDRGSFSRVATPEALKRAYVRALFHDSVGRLWVGTVSDGIFRRDPDGRWHELPAGDGGVSSSVRAFHASRGGDLWIATGGGLLRWSEGHFEALSRAEGLSSDAVRALWEDDRGDLWVGTEDAGLARVRLNPGAPLSAAQIAVVDSRQGLYADGVHHILPDQRGHLWMSSNRGVFRVDEVQLGRVADGELDQLDCVGYTEADGLPSREANGGVQSAGMRDRHGRLWFPTVAGVAVIDPVGEADNRYAPPVVIESVRVAGSREPLALPPAGSPLRLRPDQRSFEIAYTGLSFADPERVRFRVLLEGLGDQWIDVQGRRQMLYTNLAPGSYRFRVLAANEHGVWNEEGAELALLVEPRWWETTAARAGALGLLVAVAAVAIAVRTARHRRRERQLEEVVEHRTLELADALQRVTQQAESLREVDAAKSRFFALVSHELRTPLTLLLGPLLDAETNPDRLAAEAPVMRRAARGLQRLVDEILDLEKAEAGQLALTLAPRDLAAVAEGVAEVFRGLGESWGVRVLFEADPVVVRPVAAIDLEQLERVLANLISNALRFTPAGGSVVLRVTTGAEEATIEVADTGCGIPADQLERIFDRFHQAGNLSAHSDRSRGTGLGLAFVRELVQQHGGRVEVASEVGVGTTFRVHLPLCSEAPVALVAAGTPREVLAESFADGTAPLGGGVGELLDPEPLNPEDERLTVLVVDDHPEIRAYVCRVLEPALRTVPAPDGATALQLARRLLPDLVVADIGMPGMDGLELSRHLDADPETSGIPVVFLTARVTERDEAAGFAAGAVAYVRKPFSGELLQAQVSNLLQRQRRLAERLRQDPPRTTAPADTTPDLANRARQIILERLDDETFGPADLARSLAMGRTLLFQRFREELGTGPSELLRSVRLERSRELLEKGSGSVSEVAYAVGFSNLATFSRAYRARYGQPPSATLGRTERRDVQVS